MKPGPVIVWRRILAAGAAVALAGCSDNPSGSNGNGDCTACPDFAGLNVSNSVPQPALRSGAPLPSVRLGGDGVVYVALGSGTVPNGTLAVVRRVGDVVSITTNVSDGGFDPVPVSAQSGDSIDVTVTGPGGTLYHGGMVVAADRPPVIVRTDPPPRRRDVPLNTSLIVVFSEPIDTTSLTPGSISLLRGGRAVAGSIRLLDASIDATEVKVEFVPDVQLAAGTDYDLVVSQAVRDRDGQALVAAATVPFTTGTTLTQPPASISLSVDTGSVIAVGTSLQVTATVRDAAGNELTDQRVTWSTSDPTVLAVSATGLVTAVGDGYAFVGASVGSVINHTSFNVTALPPASVTVAPESTPVGANDTVMLTATVRDSTGRVINHPVMNWSSDLPTVATVVSDGLNTRIATAKGVSPGTARITASSGPGVGAAIVTVGPQVPVASVTVSPPVTTLVVQGKVQLVATLRDSTGKVLLPRPTTWTSDNGAVATVDANGLVTAAGVGSATLTATSEGVSGTAGVTVTTIVFASLSANYGTTCGLTAGGSAYCWGYNANGQIGNGTTAYSSVPVPVSGGLSFTLVTTGEAHTCGLIASGTAYCWGFNLYGALGDGSTTDRLTPAPVAGGLKFTALVAGLGHTCGLTASGAAYCWGWNGSGALGDGSTTNRLTPVPVSGGLRFTALTAGDEFSCGLVTSGAAFCWGANFSGQLGNGSTSSSSSPVGVAGGINFISINTQYLTVCGLTASGAAYCWGGNSDGQVGDGTNIDRSVPVPVIGGLTFSNVSTGGAHACGLTTSGAAYCWGRGVDGQLGDGSSSNVSFPVPVAGGLSFTAVRGGGYHTCGISTGGVAYCWGDNSFGQLGDGSTTSTNAPVKVAGQP